MSLPSLTLGAPRNPFGGFRSTAPRGVRIYLTVVAAWHAEGLCAPDEQPAMKSCAAALWLLLGSKVVAACLSVMGRCCGSGAGGGLRPDELAGVGMVRAFSEGRPPLVDARISKPPAGESIS
jgi:hypothetical protein